MKHPDATLIDRLGGIKAVAAKLPPKDPRHTEKRRFEMVKKWCQKGRGIPWEWRGAVLKIAREKRKRVPADFLTERQAA
jgi:hypothetical protein